MRYRVSAWGKALGKRTGGGQSVHRLESVSVMAKRLCSVLCLRREERTRVNECGGGPV